MVFFLVGSRGPSSAAKGLEMRTHMYVCLVQRKCESYIQHLKPKQNCHTSMIMNMHVHYVHIQSCTFTSSPQSMYLSHLVGREPTRYAGESQLKPIGFLTWNIHVHMCSYIVLYQCNFSHFTHTSPLGPTGWS